MGHDTSISTIQDHHKVFVELRKLPSFSKLNTQVQAIVSRSSWMELYGTEWLHILGGLVSFCVGVSMLRSDRTIDHVVALILMGCTFTICSSKSAHLASHGALANSQAWNHVWCILFVEFVGGFSSYLGYNIHVKIHHPHTNIIGLGDSSTWKIPMLTRSIYMFGAPLFFPLITPLVTVSELIQVKQFKELAKALVFITLGVISILYLFMEVGNLSFARSCMYIWIYRAMFSIPYIHINIFQHIGLPMYSQDHRPARVYQMSTGCLNLSRNWILDHIFGHSLVNCHVEHHLFPRLSDTMCLKIKSLVKDYLTENGLIYQEKSYMERLSYFMDKYDELMVKAPPIIHFVGIQ